MAPKNVDPSVVVENPEGASYQFIGGAVLPFDPESGAITGEAVAVTDSHAGDEKSESSAEVFRRAAPVRQPKPAPVQPMPRLAPAGTALTGPNQVVRAAKARVKELRAFLRASATAVKKAEKELRELERLVSAAKRPLAPVRDIRRSG